MALFGSKKNEDKERITTDDILMSMATTRVSINPDYMKNDAKRVVESLLYATYSGNELLLPADKMTDDYYKKIRDGLIRDKNNGIEKRLYSLEIKKVRPTNVDNSMMYLVTSVEFEIHFVVSYTQVHSTFNKSLTDEFKIRYVFMNGTNYPNKKGWILGKDCDKREMSSVEFNAEAYQQEQMQKEYARRYGQYYQQGYPQQMQNGYGGQMNGYKQMNNYPPQQGYPMQQGYQQGYPQQMQNGYGGQMNGYNQMNNYPPQQGYPMQQGYQQGYPQQMQSVYGGQNQMPQQANAPMDENQNPYVPQGLTPLEQIKKNMREQGPITPLISPEMYNLDKLQEVFGNKMMENDVPKQANGEGVEQEVGETMEQPETQKIVDASNLNNSMQENIDENAYHTQDVEQESQLQPINESVPLEHSFDESFASSETSQEVTETPTYENAPINDEVEHIALDTHIEMDIALNDCENSNVDYTNNEETQYTPNDVFENAQDDVLEENETNEESVVEEMSDISTTNFSEDVQDEEQSSDVQEPILEEKEHGIGGRVGKFFRKNKRKSMEELKKESEDFDDLDTLDTI